MTLDRPAKEKTVEPARYLNPHPSNQLIQQASKDTEKAAIASMVEVINNLSKKYKVPREKRNSAFVNRKPKIVPKP